MDGVCDEYDCLASAVEVILQSVIKDVLSDIGIESAQTVVDQIDVSVRVQGPSN